MPFIATMLDGREELERGRSAEKAAQRVDLLDERRHRAASFRFGEVNARRGLTSVTPASSAQVEAPKKSCVTDVS